MATGSQDTQAWWTRWKSRREPAPAQPDEVVTTWKAAWLAGATAAWARREPSNPYTVGHERAAWDAGWKWASQNPDRRMNRPPRLAHPQRRAGDSTLSASIKRAAAFGATGLTIYMMSRALRRWSRAVKADVKD